MQQGHCTTQMGACILKSHGPHALGAIPIGHLPSCPLASRSCNILIPQRHIIPVNPLSTVGNTNHHCLQPLYSINYQSFTFHSMSKTYSLLCPTIHSELLSQQSPAFPFPLLLSSNQHFPLIFPLLPLVLLFQLKPLEIPPAEPQAQSTSCCMRYC